MKMRSVLPVISAAALLAFAGAGQAAVAPVEEGLALGHPPGWVVSRFVTDDLVVDPLSMGYARPAPPKRWEPPHPMRSTAAAHRGWPPAHRASLLVGLGEDTDTDAPAPAGKIGTLTTHSPQLHVPASHATPFHAQLLGAGQDVLEIDSPKGQPPVSNQVSAVPLPGAMWLFGTALLAFIGIASRHRL